MDYWLLIPIIIISLIGLYVLNLVLQEGYGYGSYPSNFMKQAAAVTAGLFIALLLVFLDLPTLRLVGLVTYTLSVLMLIYVKVDSFSLAAETGADSWLEVPLIGTFQPSELAKVGIAMITAPVFARMEERGAALWRGLLELAVLYGIPLALIMTEPDFGTAFVIIMMFLVTLFIWGLRWRYIIIGAMTGIITLPLLWFFFFDDYQKGRILSFLFPGHDAAESYHITQALKAIAGGGVTGNRSGPDIPVPVKESDFIYTAIAEKLGLIGTAILLILIGIFIFRAIKVSYRARSMSPSSSYMLIALIATMSFHFVENMAMNVGLMPITGIPLPFISNGGSSMIVNFFSLGLMLNVSMNLKSMGMLDAER